MGNGSAPQVRGAPGECLCLTCWTQEGNSRGERLATRTNPPCTGIRCLKHHQSLHVSSKNGSALPHSPQNKSRAPSPGLQALRNPYRPSRGQLPSHLAFLCLAVPLFMLFLLGNALPVVGMRLSAQVSLGSSNNSYFFVSPRLEAQEKGAGRTGPSRAFFSSHCVLPRRARCGESASELAGVSSYKVTDPSPAPTP